MKSIQMVNLKRLLKQLNMTQTQLAQKTKIPISTINDYVNGKTEISKRNSQIIAEALNIDAIELEADWYAFTHIDDTVSEKVDRIISLYQFQLIKVQDVDVIYNDAVTVGEQVVFISLPHYKSHDIIISNDGKKMIFGAYQKFSDNDTILGKVIGKFEQIRSCDVLENKDN